MEPASLGKDIEGLITVCSSDAEEFRQNQKSLFSNYSKEYVEMCAPGAIDSTLTLNPAKPKELTPIGLYSTIIMNTQVGRSRVNYWFLAGTSMATPVVAGAVMAMISYAKSLNVQLTPAAVEHYLKVSSQKLHGLKKYAQDGNHLDLSEMVSCIKSLSQD